MSKIATRNYKRRLREQGKCRCCAKPSPVTYCKSCQDRISASSKNRRKRNKIEVIKAHGNKCVDCGEIDIRCLTLDHLNGDGAIDRRLENGKISLSAPWYNKLYKALPKIREDLSVRCFNCHAKKDLFKDWGD